MTREQLKEIMKFHLSNFNNEGVNINDQTVHKSVLSADDGYGAANSKRIYRSVVRWTLIRNQHEDKNWPKDWFEKDVEYLSSKII